MEALGSFESKILTMSEYRKYDQICFRYKKKRIVLLKGFT